MFHRSVAAAAFVLVFATSAVLVAAQAQPPLAHEEVVRIPLTVRGLFGAKQLNLEGTVFRPHGDGPFPLAILNHGSPRNAAERRSIGRVGYPEQSAWFLARGFAVIIPMRRGYAGSEGDWAEGGGPCDRSDWYFAGRESAKDIRAAVDFMQAGPFIDRTRILLVGQSAGGFGVLALAAEGFEGLKGVINFAGGRGSPQAGKNCSAENVIYSMGQFGRTTKVPTLWIYTENDSFFSVQMIHEMHASFRKAGGDAELILLPQFEADGHLLFSRGAKLWSPPVEGFLDRLGLARRTRS